MTKQEIIDGLEWMLAEGEKLAAKQQQFSAPPMPEAPTQKLDPAWTAVRRLLLGQTLGISPRWIREILRELKGV